MAHFDHFLAKSQLESIRNSLIQSVDLDPAQVAAIAAEQGIELPEVVVNAPPEEGAAPTPSEAEHHPLSSSGNIRSSNGFFSVLRNSMGLTSFGLSSSMNKSPPRFNLRQTINRSYTYNPDNITEKKDFLINLAKSLHIFGSPVHRTEYNMAHSCKALGVSGMFAVLPSMIIVTFGDMDRDPSKSESHILRVDQGLQCEKLNLVEGLTDDLISRKITYSEAALDLAAILIRPPRYNWKIKALCLGVSSGCIAPLFFGGYLWEAAACFVLGCTIGILSWLAEKHALMSRMFEALASLVVSFLARLFKAYWYTDVCFYPMMLASVVWLLPGLSLTIAITELATRNIISGTTRMFYCFLVCIQLGFGIAIGSRLVFWESAVPSQETCDTVPGWSNVFLFFGTALPFNILLDASPRQWIPMTIAAGIGYGASYGFSFVFASDLNSAISAFCVGLFGGFWAHFDHHPPLITVISGIIMLVPGSMGVRGVTAFFEKDVVSGINFGFNMIVIALSISIGLFFSNMIAFPKKVLTPDSLLF